MSKYNFTAEELLAEVLKLAEERPNFNYKNQLGAVWQGHVGCFYTAGPSNGDGEGCIVGQALMRLGVDQCDLSPHEGKRASDVYYGLTERPRREATGAWVVDSGEVGTLRKINLIQIGQDRGLSWGEALHYE